MMNFRPLARHAALGGVALAALLATAPAMAASHEIRMLNTGPDRQQMVFEPAYLQIQPGDTVTFKAADRTHNTETIPGMLPAGAQPWKGRVNEEVTITFTQEGIYGYKCQPHYAMGMVGIIQVGSSAANLEAARAVTQPALARTRMQALLQRVAGQ